MKISQPLFFAVFLFFATNLNLVAQSSDEDALLANWANISQKLQADTLLAAEFEMQSTDRFGANETIFGTLFLWSNGYRIETNQSKMLVFNGISTVLDATQKQMIVSTYVAEDDDFAPAKLLQEAWLANYNQQIEVKSQQILWTTEDPFENFASISLKLSAPFPTSLIAEDQLENKVSLFLSNQKWIAFDEAEKLLLFSLATPDDFELIDLRDEQ